MTEPISDNLPATTTAELEKFRTVGYWLSLSESGVDNEKVRGATAALRLYYANELGLPPLAAQELTVIKGKLVVGAQLQRAMAEQNGYRVLRVHGDDKTCTARVVDKFTGQVIGESTFTIEDAHRAGLIRDRSAWKTHPARMLWARASTLALKDYAPAVGLGMLTPDEATEITGTVVEESFVDDVEWPGDEEQRRLEDEAAEDVEL
jgi:hypothetical protein